jgi:PAS domain S-box-containing protein
VTDPLVVLDAKLQVQTANRAFYTLFGVSRDETQGVSIRKLGNSEWETSEVWKSVEATLSVNTQFHAIEIERDFPVIGSRTVVLNVSRLARDGHTSLLLTFHDMSETKRAERALRESEQRYRTVTEATPIMVWMAGLDKRCYYFNKGWLNFVGRTLEQECGHGWAEGIHRDDFDRCLQIYVSNFDARRSFEMQYRLKHHTGQYRWILDHGVPRYAPDGTFEGYVGG